MRIVFFGSGAFGVPTLVRLIDEHDVSLVVTQPDRPAGRHKVITPTPVAEAARAHGVSILRAANVGEVSIVDQIRSLNADAFVVIAFGQKLSPELLKDMFAINLHASLLPKYRGAAPINWAMINGESETGLSVITLADRMDTGDVLGQARTSIDPRETAGELHDRLSLMGPELIMRILNQKTQERIESHRQDQSLATHAPKLTKADGTVCFNQPAQHVRSRVHGLTPWPGCWVRIGDRSLRLHRVEDLTQADTVKSETEPGVVLPDRSIACAPGSGSVRLLEVQPANGKLMSFQAYCNGHGVIPGERCQPV